SLEIACGNVQGGVDESAIDVHCNQADGKRHWLNSKSGDGNRGRKNRVIGPSSEVGRSRSVLNLDRRALIRGHLAESRWLAAQSLIKFFFSCRTHGVAWRYS